MKIVFFGTPEFSADFLRTLLVDLGIEVVGVVTQPDEPLGRKKVLTPPPTKALALAHDIPVLQPTKLKDLAFAESLRLFGADAFVVIAYGRIIPQTILDIPALGCVNVHPSLLPKLRGPSPIISAIALGERETGVTIMKLDADMDHGPILAQVRISLAPDETTQSLTQKVVTHGAPLLLDTLKKYAKREIVPREQDHDSATFCKLLTREDGRIDWHESAEVIDAKIRAYNPWPSSYTVWLHRSAELTVKILSSRTTDNTLHSGSIKIGGKRLFVGTATTSLEILELQPAGGSRMTAAAFIAGYADVAALR